MQTGEVNYERPTERVKFNPFRMMEASKTTCLSDLITIARGRSLPLIPPRQILGWKCQD